MGLVGGVLTGLLISTAGWSFWWAAPVGLMVGALLGLAADRVVLVRLQDAPRAVLLVATIGLAKVFGSIQSGLPFAFGGRLPSYPLDLGFSWFISPFRLQGPHFLALLSLPLALVGLTWILERSRFGLAACALGQDAERARSLGVPSSVVRSVAWAVAGVLSTVSGILSITVLGFSLTGGIAPTVLLLAPTRAVMAGLRRLPSTVAASLALGVIYNLGGKVTSQGNVT